MSSTPFGLRRPLAALQWGGNAMKAPKLLRNRLDAWTTMSLRCPLERLFRRSYRADETTEANDEHGKDLRFLWHSAIPVWTINML